MIVVGLGCFAAFAVLLAFSRGPNRADGGAHALSRSAVGFAGVVELLRDAGQPVLVSRDPGQHGPKASLLVLTPSAGSRGPRSFADRDADTVLIVLPKWRTEAMDGHPGWVRPAGLLPASEVLDVLPGDIGRPRLKRRDGTARPALSAAPSFGSAPTTAAIDRLQTLADGKWVAALEDDDGGIVLGQATEDGPYVLSDPDLLNDLAMNDPAGAQGAASLVNTLADGGSVAFDVSLNGFGRSRDPLLLIMQPPLLGATLCAVAAGLLSGLLSAKRFGPARIAGRAFEFGKRGLADNSAALIARAGREKRMARPYAELTRHLAARATAAPRGLSPAELDAFLNRAALARGEQPFAPLLAESGAVRDSAGLLRAARRLHRWRMGFVHGHR